MKKLLSVLLILCMCFALVACGNEDTSETKATEAGTVANQSDAATVAAPVTPAAKDKTLVVYFSATGNTEKIAGYIATVTGGDLHKIVPVNAYSSDDINYNDKNSRSTKEQNDKNARPAISSKIENWADYDKIFIGFPIWWYEEPRIMDTFVESYDFTGKTVVTFCTSGSSGIGSSAKNLEGLAKGKGKWLDGTRIDVNITHNDMCTWVNGLGLGYNAK